MSEHITEVKQSVIGLRRGKVRKGSRAVCSCGWEGPIEPHLEAAHNDASGHEAAAYIESLPRPLRAV